MSEIVHTIDATVVLDRQQLRDITMEDQDMMREIVVALIEDTSSHIDLLQTAIRDRDSNRCKRLAHYSKGACANVGANAAAAVLLQLERQANAGSFDDCASSLAALATELERLKAEAGSL